MSRVKESVKPYHQPDGVLPAKTMELILSVTDAKVWPGRKTCEEVAGGGGVSRVGASGVMSRGLQLHDLGARIAYGSEVGRPRLSIVVLQESVIECCVFHLADPRIRIVEVPENDRVSRARGLTCGQYLSIVDRRDAWALGILTTLVLGLYFRRPDALHAISAFLHDAAASNRHLRVVKQFHALSGEVGILEEIEAPNFIGAVIRAVTRADTAVIDHVVEPIIAVHRSANRTDHFTRRLF